MLQLFWSWTFPSYICAIRWAAVICPAVCTLVFLFTAWTLVSRPGLCLLLQPVASLSRPVFPVCSDLCHWAVRWRSVTVVFDGDKRKEVACGSRAAREANNTSKASSNFSFLQSDLLRQWAIEGDGPTNVVRHFSLWRLCVCSPWLKRLLWSKNVSNIAAQVCWKTFHSEWSRERYSRPDLQY